VSSLVKDERELTDTQITTCWQGKYYYFLAFSWSSPCGLHLILCIL